MSGAASDRREETETIMLQHVHYFPREVIEPSARVVFIFGLWSREKSRERVRNEKTTLLNFSETRNSVRAKKCFSRRLYKLQAKLVLVHKSLKCLNSQIAYTQFSNIPSIENHFDNYPYQLQDLEEIYTYKGLHVCARTA